MSKKHGHTHSKEKADKDLDEGLGERLGGRLFQSSLVASGLDSDLWWGVGEEVNKLEGQIWSRTRTLPRNLIADELAVAAASVFVLVSSYLWSNKVPLRLKVLPFTVAASPDSCERTCTRNLAMERNAQRRCLVAASGAGEDDDAFDRRLAEQWVEWRASYPIRGTGGVRRTGKQRPTAQGQQEWCLYTARGLRITQEWWMPPLLVPIVGDVPSVHGGGALPLVTVVDPASGVPCTQRYYTDIYRMELLAQSHPLVLTVERHDFGRPLRVSPFDLRLTVVSCARMLVGCSFDGARDGLLSLWWAPAGGFKLTVGQESVAQAVFFDLAEAAHDVPGKYQKAYYNAAAGAPSAGDPAAPARGERGVHANVAAALAVVSSHAQKCPTQVTEVLTASAAAAVRAAPGSPASSAELGSPADGSLAVMAAQERGVQGRGSRSHAAPEGLRALWLYSFECVSREAPEDVARLLETSDDHLWWGSCQQGFSDDVERLYQDLQGESHLVLMGRRSRGITVDLDKRLQEDERGKVRKIRRVLVQVEEQ